MLNESETLSHARVNLTPNPPAKREEPHFTGYCLSYLLLAPHEARVLPTPYEREIERLRKLPVEVETDEDPDFDNEDNGPEDALKKIFSDHESLCEHDTESEEGGDCGN
ncbi:hypothetical protein AVEN_152970-1 [Araneus ventricosus]|uniref:Uncharacterized protein n=1 Tax=Araneus ventricosus TaxID=182803 RepID=A0A4Y2ADT7_ARAVE|nr:hypothetical protein AVEN_152970-1 [Araneus ventricosus]